MRSFILCGSMSRAPWQVLTEDKVVRCCPAAQGSLGKELMLRPPLLDHADPLLNLVLLPTSL